MKPESLSSLVTAYKAKIAWNNLSGIASRAIERLWRENVLFMAISGDSAPQFTTIAKFIRELADEVSAIFTQCRALLAS